MTTGMMTLGQAGLWLPEAQLLGDVRVNVLRVHTDSRTLQAGDLFVALKGDKFDGNQFLAQAQSQGAVAAICESPEALAQSGLSGLVVADARKALTTLACAWRAQFTLPLIAVTGSNGKTTVTQMIASILRAHAPQAMLATEGNFNNDIGVPLTLLRLRRQHQIAVVELGMNHPGEIAQLSALAKPTIALVNNAQREHMEFMATVDAVALENGAVFGSLPSPGVAVFPADAAFSTLWHGLAAPHVCMTFSDIPQLVGADVVCVAVDWNNHAWRIQVQTPAGPLACALRIAGRHNVANALAAITCTLAAGVPISAIAQGLENFEPVRGRSRTVVGDVSGHLFTLIDDTYNANPDSVKAAIEVLASLPGPRLLVLGDMGEVGEFGPQFHEEAGAHAKSAGIEGLCTLGDLSGLASKAYGDAAHFTDVNSLNAALLDTLKNYRSVLVKGSRFMRMERVVNALAAPAQNSTQSSAQGATQKPSEAACC